MFHAPTTFFALGKVPGGVQTAVFECPLSEYEEFKQSFYYELVVARTSSVELVAGVDGVLHGVPVWEVFPDIAPERVDLPDVLSDDTLHDGRALAPCIGHCADTCAHYTASPCAFLTTSSTRMCLAHRHCAKRVAVDDADSVNTLKVRERHRGLNLALCLVPGEWDASEAPADALQLGVLLFSKNKCNVAMTFTKWLQIKTSAANTELHDIPGVGGLTQLVVVEPDGSMTYIPDSVFGIDYTAVPRACIVPGCAKFTFSERFGCRCWNHRFAIEGGLDFGPVLRETLPQDFAIYPLTQTQ